MLGAAQAKVSDNRKKFMPNLNVTRNVKKEGQDKESKISKPNDEKPLQ